MSEAMVHPVEPEQAVSLAFLAGALPAERT